MAILVTGDSELPDGSKTRSGTKSISFSRDVTRQLVVESFQTHVADTSIVYARWSDDPNTYSWVIMSDQYLENIVELLRSPADLHFEQFFTNPHVKKIEDAKMRPMFYNQSFVDLCNERGGYASSYDSEHEPFVPTKWGDVPEKDMVCILMSLYDHTMLNRDGSYALLSVGDSMIAEYWDFSVLYEWAECDDAKIRIVGDEYYVPGNGDTINIAIDLTPEQYKKIKNDTSGCWNRMETAMALVGYDVDLAKKERDY